MWPRKHKGRPWPLILGGANKLGFFSGFFSTGVFVFFQPKTLLFLAFGKTENGLFRSAVTAGTSSQNGDDGFRSDSFRTED
jgi:hypothetical protein